MYDLRMADDIFVWVLRSCIQFYEIDSMFCQVHVVATSVILISQNVSLSLAGMKRRNFIANLQCQYIILWKQYYLYKYAT